MRLQCWSVLNREFVQLLVFSGPLLFSDRAPSLPCSTGLWITRVTSLVVIQFTSVCMQQRPCLPPMGSCVSRLELSCGKAIEYIQPTDNQSSSSNKPESHHDIS